MKSFIPGRASHSQAKNALSLCLSHSVFPLSFKGGIHAVIYWWHQYVKHQAGKKNNKKKKTTLKRNGGGGDRGEANKNRKSGRQND